MVLLMDSSWAILYYGKNPLKPLRTDHDVNLYLDFLGHFFKNTVVIIMIPLVLVLSLYLYISKRIPESKSVLEGVQLCILYALGVYATYRHTIWRNKHLKHKAEKTLFTAMHGLTSRISSSRLLS